MAASTDFPTDVHLHLLARAIGGDKDLLAAYLGISKTDLEMIELDYNTTPKQNFQMLHIWRERTALDSEHRFHTLKACMEKCRKVKLVEMVEDCYNEYTEASAAEGAKNRGQNQLKMQAPIQEGSSSTGPCKVVKVNPSDKRIKELLQDKGVYPIKSNVRGRAVIINNENFVKLSTREGTKADRDNLVKLLHQLHFETDEHYDKTGKEIKAILEQESKNPYHARADAFIFCVLSHGGEGSVFGTDSEEVKIVDDICAAFYGQNCASLIGKPKIFLIQACQGKNRGAKVMVPDDDSSTDESPIFLTYKHGKGDMLVAYPTVPGDLSWRNTQTGTRFIQAIVKVFEERAHSDHIVDLLTKVRARIEEDFQNQVQLTRTDSTLSKDFYFFPGYNPE